MTGRELGGGEQQAREPAADRRASEAAALAHGDLQRGDALVARWDPRRGTVNGLLRGQPRRSMRRPTPVSRRWMARTQSSPGGEFDDQGHDRAARRDRRRSPAVRRSVR